MAWRELGRTAHSGPQLAEPVVLVAWLTSLHVERVTANDAAGGNEHAVAALRRSVNRIAQATMDALVRYPWPGNIRELQNLIERAVIRSSGDCLEVPVSALEAGSETPKSLASPPQTLEGAERALIVSTLRETGWVLAGPRGAAQRLGIHRSTLQFRMKKLGIERPLLRD